MVAKRNILFIISSKSLSLVKERNKTEPNFLVLLPHLFHAQTV